MSTADLADTAESTSELDQDGYIEPNQTYLHRDALPSPQRPPDYNFGESDSQALSTQYYDQILESIRMIEKHQNFARNFWKISETYELN